MKKLILALLSKVGIGVGGVGGWLTSLIIDRFLIWAEKNIESIVKQVVDYFKLKKQRETDQQNQQQYEQTIHKPEVTNEEVDQATDDLLNGRRR